MNYKLEKFWNTGDYYKLAAPFIMNYKLEKFWNNGWNLHLFLLTHMNYKLEKFWNNVEATNLDGAGGNEL